MRIAKIISTAITKGRLIIKVLGLGSNDVQTVYNILPFGVDSNPVSNLRAIIDRTENYEDRVLLGVLLENAITAKGETRIYSTNANGNEVFSIHLKNNGNVEIGGNTDNAVRYIKLNDALQDYKSKVNTELTKIAAAINAIVPGSYTPLATTIDISESKINNIKTS